MRGRSVKSVYRLLIALHDAAAPGLLYILYDFLAAAALLFALPLLVYRMAASPGLMRGFRERLGFVPAEARARPGFRAVWVHGASVGEVLAARPLVRGLRESCPGCRIIVSALTPSGRSVARAKIFEADAVICLPLDLSFIVGKVIRAVKPDVLVLIETELWPNLIRSADKSGAKIILASGAVSPRSASGFGKFRPLLEDMLSRIDVFSMQSEGDAARIISLGARRDRTSNNGNIKFNCPVPDPESGPALRREFGAGEGVFVVAAGSTHRGEEAGLALLYKELRSKFPGLLMVVAPRHPGRAREAEAAFLREGIRTIRRTRIKHRSGEDVIIMDTMGELGAVYAMADLVFVGGSLVREGGHNILEAVAAGKPVFFGPWMHDFRDEREAVLNEGLGFEARDVRQLARDMQKLLENGSLRADIAERAADFMGRNGGAAPGNLRLILQLLEQGPSIALIRLSALGDVVHALPAACSLRRGRPRSELTWIVEDGAAGAVANNPFIDRVVVIPRSAWERSFKRCRPDALREAVCFFSILKRYNFDIALDLHGLLKSALTAFFSGAHRKIGPSDGREGSVLFYNETISIPGRVMHQVDRNLFMARAAGGAPGRAVFGVSPSAVDRERVFRRIYGAGKRGGRPLAAINPFTTWESKNWTLEGWAAVADGLAGEMGYEVVFTGGPDDRRRVEEIMRLMRTKAVNLAGETTLGELAGLFSSADVFVGGDTGPMHLAAAAGARVVALMGSTTAATHGPYGAGHKVVQKAIPCSGCWRRACPLKTGECMKSIKAGEVIEAAGKPGRRSA